MKNILNIKDYLNENKGEKENIIVLHGTQPQYVEKIKEEGLKSRRERKYNSITRYTASVC